MSTSSSDLYFELTPQLYDACRKCIRMLPKTCAKPKEIADISKSKQSTVPSTTVISLSGIKTLSQLLRAHGKGKENSGFWVHQLLRGSRIHIDKPEKKPRDPALDARLDAIRKQLEEYEYQKMTANVVSPSLAYAQSDNKSTADSRAESLFPAVPGVRVGRSARHASFKQDMKAANQQISVIINILFSALGVGFAVAYASYTLTDEIGWRVLLGLLAAVVIVLAETWLFVLSGSRGQKKRLELSFFKPDSGISAREALAKKKL
ncbi:hypothetical protein IW140_002253 [Coemansia sp. RSA 1813]|nr:hypothetical protein EV178_001762 [Coemansia sp. RSA 1646]KAJ2092925.1 hypothetical protein IW138_000638 [Coemansia sp. RSA 986]KAJ2216246.1 hypothetical protein EV179_001484 [Coemansia sp. RSA 487]KAJ2570581.1 hypothetical protein IW140_002253 [Coemansia sp. RSA 1813]